MFPSQYLGLQGVLGSEQEQQMLQDQQRALLLNHFATDEALASSLNSSSLPIQRGQMPSNGSLGSGGLGSMSSTAGLSSLLELERANATRQQLLQDALVRRRFEAEHQQLMLAAHQPNMCFPPDGNLQLPSMSMETQSNNRKRDISDKGAKSKQKKTRTNNGPNSTPMAKGGPGGPLSVPCRCRGMPDDHNPKTAFIVIPDDVDHGQALKCSHPICRNRGDRFRYCSACQRPVAKRNFSSRHNHPDEAFTKAEEEKKARQAQLRLGNGLPEDKGGSAGGNVGDDGSLTDPSNTDFLNTKGGD